jgi:hypothetical protein
MQYKRILLILIVMIFMTGTLSAEAATTGKAVALEPWTNEIVDDIANVTVGTHVSIAHSERDGRAYISYYDSTNQTLKLAYQVSPGTGNCPDNSNWRCSTLYNGPNDVGRFSSIDVVDASVNLITAIQGELNAAPPHQDYTKIGISFYDATDGALKFALYKCVSAQLYPDCGWNITTVDDDSSPLFGANIGQNSSFKFGTDAVPIIYYHEGTGITNTGRVKRAYLPTGGTFSGHCGTGWTCEVVAQSTSSPDYGTHISADGSRIVFYDLVNTRLMMAKSVGVDTANCGLMNRWDCSEIDNNGIVGKFASLYYDGVHHMQIAYYDASNGKVKYAIETSGVGTGCTNNKFNCFAVDTIGTTTLSKNIGISLTLDAQSQPVIAYQDFHEDMAPARLKLARPSTAYGELVGNCGAVPPGYLFQYFQCSVLDWGGQYQNEADYAAVSVSPAGLATVAYYEIFESAQDVFEGRLKVAQQHFGIYLPLINK